MSTKKPRVKLPVRLNRKSPDTTLPRFQEYFQGFEKVGAVRAVFGDSTEEVLRNLRVGFIPNRGMYMGIRDDDGNIAVGTYHLRTSPTRTLYLDVVHELFHVNQRMTNEKYFHDEFMKFMRDRSLYYSSPIEIPAYAHTVREAERIGMTREEILQYLKFGEAPPRTWKRFVKEMDLGRAAPAKRVTRFPVKIRRETSPDTHPFTDYFLGFERVQTVRALLGDSTETFLNRLKVEFIDTPFAAIYPSEEDGHLIVTNFYFRKGTVASIYLDVFLSLLMLKSASKGEASSKGLGEWGAPGTLKAYSEMVKEARRLGQDDEEILRHLTLPSFWMKPREYRDFLKTIGVRRA